MFVTNIYINKVPIARHNIKHVIPPCILLCVIYIYICKLFKHG